MTSTPFSTATARKVFKMKTDAWVPEQLIFLANDLAPDGLDSFDLGDALGEFIRQLETATDLDGLPANELMIPGDGFTVTISCHWELFEWGGELPPGPADHLKPGDIG